MKTELKIRGTRFCRIEVKLEDGRLSVCGSEGRVISRFAGKQQALAYWRSFFEDQPEEIMGLNKRFNLRLSSASGAAKYVIGVDGDLHGLDVEAEIGSKLLITESCGQIQESLREWFPEYAALLPHHLNDMRAECVHQEARGETWTKNPDAVCPDCGYKLGSAWLKRELPSEVIALAETVGAQKPKTKKTTKAEKGATP